MARERREIRDYNRPATVTRQEVAQAAREIKKNRSKNYGTSPKTVIVAPKLKRKK